MHCGVIINYDVLSILRVLTIILLDFQCVIKRKFNFEQILKLWNLILNNNVSVLSVDYPGSPHFISVLSVDYPGSPHFISVHQLVVIREKGRWRWLAAPGSRCQYLADTRLHSGTRCGHAAGWVCGSWGRSQGRGCQPGQHRPEMVES